MNELLAKIRTLVDDRAGFTTAHPTLVDYLPADIGHAAKVLIAEGVLVKWRSGDGRVRFRGAHLPKPRRKDAGVQRKPRAAPDPRVDQIVDVLRRLAKACPKGFVTKHPDLAARWTSETVGKSAAHLVRRGELFKVRASHKLVYYFGSMARAQAAEARLIANNTMSTRGHTHVSIQAPRALEGPADFSRARLVVCPGFVPRNVALDVLCPLLAQVPHRRAA